MSLSKPVSAISRADQETGGRMPVASGVPEPFDYQWPHVRRSAAILRRNKFLLDTSPTGTGKTPMTLYWAWKNGYLPFVVCPASARGVWEENMMKFATETAGMDYYAIISYSTLAGKEGYDLSHEYLIRLDEYPADEKGKTRHKISYLPAQELLDIIAETARGSRAVFVFDEAQNVKNRTSARFSAVKTITTSVMDIETNARMIFLSATMFDKARHAETFFRLFGFITVPKLWKEGLVPSAPRGYNRSGEISALFGMTELFNVMTDMMPEELTTFIDKHPEVDDPILEEEQAEKLVLALYTELIVPNFSSAMPRIRYKDRNGREVVYDLANGYYVADPKVREVIAGALADLAEVLARYAHIRPLARWQELEILKAINVASEKIEIAKAPLFAELVLRVLREGPEHAKPIIAVRFHKTMAGIEEVIRKSEFADVYKRMDGKMVPKNRDKVIAQFQEPNDDLRLLVMGVEVGKEAISLHDTDGNFPRFMFIAPSFFFTSIVQATGRPYRAGIQSDVVARLVYVLGHEMIPSEDQLMTEMEKQLREMLRIGQDQQLPLDEARIRARYPAMEYNMLNNLLSKSEVTDSILYKGTEDEWQATLEMPSQYDIVVEVPAANKPDYPEGTSNRRIIDASFLRISKTFSDDGTTTYTEIEEPQMLV